VGKPRIAVIRAGAIGGITAAVLKKAGYDVNLVTKYPELAKKIEDEKRKISPLNFYMV
jgi:ketopantoate reductase